MTIITIENLKSHAVHHGSSGRPIKKDQWDFGYRKKTLLYQKVSILPIAFSPTGELVPQLEMGGGQ